MAFVISQHADYQQLIFDGELNISGIRETFDAVMVALADKPAQVNVDVTSVQDFDSAGLQLLLYLQSWLQPGKMTITGSDNPVVARLLTLYQCRLAEGTAE